MKAILAEASRAPSAKQVEDIVMSAPVTDIHTHLYDPAFKELLLWGIDDLLVYHYLVAEAFRYLDMPYDKFWSLSKTAAGGPDLGRALSPALAGFRSLPRRADHPARDGPGREEARSARLAPLVREPDRGPAHHPLHGAGGRAEDLHDQFALRRPGTPGLGEGLPPG